jgi:hypothetical protein
MALLTYENPEGFVTDKPYLVQEITPYKVALTAIKMDSALTTIKMDCAFKEQSRLMPVELLFKTHLPRSLQEAHYLWVILDVGGICIAMVYERWADRRKMYNSLRGGVTYLSIGSQVLLSEEAE